MMIMVLLVCPPPFQERCYMPVATKLVKMLVTFLINPYFFVTNCLIIPKPSTLNKLLNEKSSVKYKKRMHIYTFT